MSKTMREALAKGMAAVTKDFVREKRRAATRDNDDYLTEAQLARLAEKEEKNEIKEAAYQVMEEAYNLASDNGGLPANARQIMYAARPKVLQITGGKCWANSSYFTQTLLPKFREEFPDKTASWDVVYDPRGHFREPHGPKPVSLGTIGVRQYVNGWKTGEDKKTPTIVIDKADSYYPTWGPLNRFRYALFIEKEGFDPILDRAAIADRFDLAIFSSKGVSTTATRQLVDALAGSDVTILILHDFDIYGLGIAHTLVENSDRYQFRNTPKVIDLGLRLVDVTDLNLQSERWEDRKLQKSPGERLFRYGATKAEEDFLVDPGTFKHGVSGYFGKRVELNAMTSRQFIDWLEGKLRKHGVEKMIPGEKTLELAYHRARDAERLNKALEKIQNEQDTEPVPKGLRKKVQNLLGNNYPRISWDRAVGIFVHREMDKQEGKVEKPAATKTQKKRSG
jgi:hypothetical protein